MGGTSSERDVSFASSLRIIEALRSRGHEVSAVDPATGPVDAAAEQALRQGGVKTTPPTVDELERLQRNAITATLGSIPAVRSADVVYIGLHGGQGEDGTVQALLDMAGIRYTGSGHLASALAMDKDLSKILFRAAGVRTADWIMAPADLATVERTLGLPVIVKPSKQGSTVGLTLVKKREDLATAVEEAFRHDDEVMIEQFIAGREFTVTILGDQALPVGEIKPKHEIYDYECKYTKGMAEEEFPAQLTPAQTADAQRQALLAFRALKLRGCARIDFRMTEDGTFYCLEANTLPGMTELSLAPQGAAAAGISFSELCERIVQLARETRP